MITNRHDLISFKRKKDDDDVEVYETSIYDDIAVESMDAVDATIHF